MVSPAYIPLDVASLGAASRSSASPAGDDDVLNFDHWLMPPIEQSEREWLVRMVSRLAGPVILAGTVFGLSAALL